MAREEMPNYLQEQPEEEADAVVVLERRHGQLFVDAGRVLMLWGWGALAAAVSTAGNRLDSTNTTHAFLGFLLWLLGVSLVTLVPVARRFPLAAGVGAAVAIAVMDCFVPPWN